MSARAVKDLPPRIHACLDEWRKLDNQGLAFEIVTMVIVFEKMARLKGMAIGAGGTVLMMAAFRFLGLV